MMLQDPATWRGALLARRGRDAEATYAGRVSQASTEGEAGRPGRGGAVAAVLGDAPVVDVTRLRVTIARLSRRLRKHELAGLTPTQLSALSTVERTGPLRLGDLAAAEQIAPSTLTRLVSVLEEHGYVQRRAVPGDARAWMLVVTERGHEVLDQIRQENTLLLADSLLTLSPGQLTALAAALPALEQLAEAIPHPAAADAATAGRADPAD
jgi:DNA-binding MarR family transcriptional regulator